MTHVAVAEMDVPPNEMPKMFRRLNDKCVLARVACGVVQSHSSRVSAGTLSIATLVWLLGTSRRTNHKIEAKFQ